MSDTELGVLRTAAEAGDPVAQSELEQRHHEGRDGLATDHRQAAAWWEKAAAKAETRAVFNMGVLYLNGDLGSRDMPRALQYFKRSGKVLGRAAHLVACILYRGNGVPKDEAGGVLWYRKAEELGEADAQRFLGDRHMSGGGFE